MTGDNMEDMASHNRNGPENGASFFDDPGLSSSDIARPFTLQESLPYSPQTSTVPFLPGENDPAGILTMGTEVEIPNLIPSLDIIPDPSVGSGSPSLQISDLFSTQDFDRVNQEAVGKSFKQTVDHVLHDLKPAKRTQ